MRGGLLPVLGTFQGGAALPAGPRMPANGFLGVGWGDRMGQKLKPLAGVRWFLISPEL